MVGYNGHVVKEYTKIYTQQIKKLIELRNTMNNRIKAAKVVAAKLHEERKKSFLYKKPKSKERFEAIYHNDMLFLNNFMKGIIRRETWERGTGTYTGLKLQFDDF